MPIVTTNSSPAGRIRRVKAPAVSGGSGTPFFEENFTGGVAKTTNDGGFFWASPTYTATDPTYLGQDRSISSDMAYSGTHSMKWVFGPDADPLYGQQNAAWYFTMNRNLTELWIEYYWYVPSNFAHRLNDTLGNPNKLLALYRDSYASGDMLMIEQFSRNNIGGDFISKTKHIITQWHLPGSAEEIDGAGDFGLVGPTGPVIPGQWNKMQTHFRAASSNSSADGIYHQRANGTTIANITNGKFWGRTSSPNYANNAYVNGGYFFGVTNSGYTALTTFYMDAFKFYDVDPGWS